jgi:hypothetical protein
MKKIILFFSFMLTSLFYACCQNEFSIKAEVIPYDASNKSKYGLDTIIQKRNESLNFYKSLLVISEPSTISLRFTDYTFETNPSDQKKSFNLNANVKTPIALGGKNWGLFTIQLIPHFDVRIFHNDPSHQDTSSPVRTPSYIPGIALYFSCPKMWHETPEKRYGWFMGLYGFHHSNGQDGAEILPNGKVNLYNGNFGEQIVPELIIGHYNEFLKKNASQELEKLYNKILARSSLISENGRAYRIRYWKLSLEYHDNSITNKEFLKYNIYGRYRLNGQYGCSFIPEFHDVVRKEKEMPNKLITVTEPLEKEIFRFVLNFSFIADPDYNTGDINNLKPVNIIVVRKRLNCYGTLYWRITGAPNAGVFVQGGYYGSDPYNVYFQQSMWFIRFGVAMAFFKYPKSGDFSPEPVYFTNSAK